MKISVAASPLVHNATFMLLCYPPPPPPLPPQPQLSDREKKPIIIPVVICAQGTLLACTWIYTLLVLSIR